MGFHREKWSFISVGLKNYYSSKNGGRNFRSASMKNIFWRWSVTYSVLDLLLSQGDRELRK